MLKVFVLHPKKIDMIDFKDKEYPSVSVQGVVLATNVLFLSKSPNFFVFLSIGIVILLFCLQAIASVVRYWSNIINPNFKFDDVAKTVRSLGLFQKRGIKKQALPFGWVCFNREKSNEEIKIKARCNG